MNKLYLDTLLLLSDSLHDRVNTNTSADSWHAVFKELQAHAVAALVAKNVVNMNLSSDDKLGYMRLLGLSFRNYNNILLEQGRLLNSLQDVGVNVAVLKGTSAAQYYPNPEYRSMGDIDVLVSTEDFDKARRMIEKMGFVPVPEEEKYERHIGFHNANGLEIELHRYFSSVGTKEQRDYLDGRLKSSLKCCENGVLPEVDNGLVLIGHVAQHLRSGLGLRQIIDWMMYAKANLTDEFWNNEFCEPAKNCGFEQLAKVTTAMCCKYLGLDIGITWCSDVNEDVVDALMEYIMSQGNFGRKRDSSERDASTVLNNFRNPVSLFKYLQAGGKTHWKLARTNKFFGCFAWIYQIGHIIKMGLTKKIGLKKLRDSRDESSNIVKLMEELQIKDY